MITLEKNNQVYTVSKDTALYRQLVDNGFKELEKPKKAATKEKGDD